MKILFAQNQSVPEGVDSIYYEASDNQGWLRCGCCEKPSWKDVADLINAGVQRLVVYKEWAWPPGAKEAEEVGLFILPEVTVVDIYSLERQSKEIPGKWIFHDRDEWKYVVQNGEGDWEEP